MNKKWIYFGIIVALIVFIYIYRKITNKSQQVKRVAFVKDIIATAVEKGIPTINVATTR